MLNEGKQVRASKTFLSVCKLDPWALQTWVRFRQRATRGAAAAAVHPAPGRLTGYSKFMQGLQHIRQQRRVGQ